MRSYTGRFMHWSNDLPYLCLGLSYKLDVLHLPVRTHIAPKSTRPRLAVDILEDKQINTDLESR